MSTATINHYGMNWPLLLYYIPHTVRGVAGLLTCMASGHFIEYSERVRLVDMTPACAHSIVVSSLVPRPRPKIGKGAWCHLQKLQYVLNQHIMQLVLIITFYVIDLLRRHVSSALRNAIIGNGEHDSSTPNKDC